jgi:phosphoenolpyruvate carboxylase
MNVVPVLTAHPTEVRRRSMVDRETEISRLMALRRHHLPPSMDAEIRERLFREIALMWRTRLYRPERITVKDEIRNALSIVRTSILPAVIDLYADWSQQIGEHGQMAPLLKMGSWLGGDRDGHPGVNGDTLKLALASQARVILDWYAAEVRKLWSNLAVSTAYAPVSEELLALAAQTKDPSVHRLDEPYRLALELIFDRLTAVSQKLTNQWVAFANGTHRRRALRPSRRLRRRPEDHHRQPGAQRRRAAGRLGPAHPGRGGPGLRLPPDEPGPAPERRRPRADAARAVPAGRRPG